MKIILRRLLLIAFSLFLNFFGSGLRAETINVSASTPSAAYDHADIVYDWRWFGDYVWDDALDDWVWDDYAYWGYGYCGVRCYANYTTSVADSVQDAAYVIHVPMAAGGYQNHSATGNGQSVSTVQNLMYGDTSGQQSPDPLPNLYTGGNADWEIDDDIQINSDGESPYYTAAINNGGMHYNYLSSGDMSTAPAELAAIASTVSSTGASTFNSSSEIVHPTDSSKRREVGKHGYVKDYGGGTVTATLSSTKLYSDYGTSSSDTLRLNTLPIAAAMGSVPSGGHGVIIHTHPFNQPPSTADFNSAGVGAGYWVITVQVNASNNAVTQIIAIEPGSGHKIHVITGGARQDWGF